AAEESKVLATINGIKLTQQDFRSFIKMRMRNQKQSSKLTQQQIESLFNEFINRELLYQDALKKK
ncbi:MAG: hypothetical protein GWO08_02280, partial [Gammaproteobacteria bacterium]|nr:hypothetical protein [Gammaproteobacteria bacterium]NIR92525.1 hypothetical protein [Gammaproteobacteria bacterium]